MSILIFTLPVDLTKSHSFLFLKDLAMATKLNLVGYFLIKTFET
jgi:hypothetical protein